MLSVALALHAAALRYAQRDGEADHMFERVNDSVRNVTAAQGAYPRYLIALDAWQRREYAHAQTLARENLERHPDDFESIALLGWIAVKAERFADAIPEFERAFAAANVAEPRSLLHLCTIMQQILVAGIETIDLSACERMRVHYERTEWTDATRTMQFGALISLLDYDLLLGDLDRAWFTSRTAIAVAPTDAFIVHAEVASAVVTSRLGDETTSSLQFDHAWELIRTTSWGGSNAASRVSILSFATEAAFRMPVEARQALMLYLSIKEREVGLDVLTHDRRISALEMQAAGRVAEAIGELVESRQHYERALRLWQQLGFTMRAAETALDLLRLTKDAVYREPIAELEKRAPNAWIVRAARDA